MKQDGLHFTFDFTAKKGDSPLFSVVEFTLKERLNTLFELTLSVVSHDPAIDLAGLILKNGVLTVYNRGKVERKITGIIASASKGKAGFHRTFYTLVVRPSLWLLTQRHLSRLFKQKTIPEVLTELMSDYDIGFETRLFDDHEAHDMIMQRREFDFDLFERLAAQEGLVFWTECNENGQDICCITDSYLGYKRSQQLHLSYQENSTNTLNNKVIVDVTQTVNMTPQTYIGKDRLYENPQRVHLHKTQNKTVNTNPDYFPFIDGNPRLPSPSAASKIADYRLEALQAQSVIGTAKSNDISLQPGKGFRILGHPDPNMNTRWQPIAITHHGQLPQSLQEDGQNSDGAYLKNDIIFIPDDVTWRPEYRPKPTAEGAETARVVGPEGEEIFTNALGEVLVEFFWDLTAQPQKRMTRWVRVAQDWSGNHFGFYAVPRIGQEVVIDYLEGDIDRPIIIGSVYNGDDTLPLNLPAQKTQTVMKTKTHKGQGYNELRFEDEKDIEEIFIRAQRDMTSYVQHDQSDTIGHDRVKEIGNDQRFVIGQDDSLDVKRDQSIVIGQDQREEIGQDRITKIGRHDRLEIQDRAHYSIHANFDLEVDGDHTQKIQAKQQTEVGESSLLHTRVLTLNGSEKVLIQGPAGKITIDQSGITLDAPMIKLNGPVAVSTGAIAQLKTLENAAKKGMPLVDICQLCRN